MPERSVLVVEDDAGVRAVLSGLLEDAGLATETAADGVEALERFSALAAAGRAPDVVLSDLSMPRLDGLELLDRLKALDPAVLVVFVTAYSSVDSAVAALRKGAFDYLAKPFRNDQLVQVVRNAITQRDLFRENRTLRRELARTYGFQEIVGRSPGMAALFRVVERAAPTSASILIHGETGSGKELVARAVHHASPRADRPFVSINCAALPEGLLESELFGHEKGSFSGAVGRSLGLFRAAHGGTLFLDEIGEMPQALQAKLLRALESREIRPVGATESVAIDVRIVAATNRNLEAEIAAGHFREDLYFRFAVIEVHVPPLRERPDDIPLLARHFLRAIARERGEPERRLAPAALERLLEYPWPGNVRELLNAVEHATTLGDETIGVDDLPARIRGWSPADPPIADDAVAPSLTLAEVERRHVLRAVARAGGDRKAAADALGIDLSTLYRKLKRWEGDA
jgi:DNA-binding NtrC family response regulator